MCCLYKVPNILTDIKFDEDFYYKIEKKVNQTLEKIIFDNTPIENDEYRKMCKKYLDFDMT